MGRFRRMIVRAAPTCTLWRWANVNVDALEFRLRRRWKISGLELLENGAIFPKEIWSKGWTKNSTHTDRALRVVTGAVSSGGH